MFGTLAAARKLKVAGFDTMRAEAIVKIMGQSVTQLVTREHFDAAIARLDARIDVVEEKLPVVREHSDAGFAKLDACIDAFETNLIARIDAFETRMTHTILIAGAVLISAMALMVTVAGIFLSRGGG